MARLRRLFRRRLRSVDCRCWVSLRLWTARPRHRKARARRRRGNAVALARFCRATAPADRQLVTRTNVASHYDMSNDGTNVGYVSCTMERARVCDCFRGGKMCDLRGRSPHRSCGAGSARKRHPGAPARPPFRSSHREKVVVGCRD